MEYKHFSHHHNLNIYKAQEGQQHHCHGCCQLLCKDSSIYACWHCNFFLHEHCGNATRYVKHPSHPLHPLILVPSPTYCSGSFICNACGSPGTSFSYCCALCEVDLHLNCAFLPQIVSHRSHQHELMISYTYTAMPESDQNKGSPELCKICTKPLGQKNWSYVCSTEPECDFQVHTFCATTEVKPGLYQDCDDPPDSEPSPHANTADQTDVTPAEAVAELMQLQAQLQLAEQFAQMMASFNISHLA